MDRSLSLVFEHSEFVAKRIDDLGILDIETVRHCARACGIRLTEELGEGGEVGGEAVKGFLRQANHLLDDMRRYRPDTFGKQGTPPTTERLESLLLLLTILLPRWSADPEASQTFARLNTIFRSARAFDGRRYGMFARSVGGLWAEYASAIPEEYRQEVFALLLDSAPQFLLTSVSVPDLDEATVKRFEIQNAIPANGFRLEMMPYCYSPLIGGLQLQTHTVCPSAEGYFVHVSKHPEKRIDILYRGKTIGFYKKNGERTFVVTRTVTQDNKVLMLKEGIYEFHNLRLDENQNSVDLAELEQLICVTPLRMWEKGGATDIVDPSPERAPEAFENIVSRISPAVLPQ